MSSDDLYERIFEEQRKKSLIHYNVINPNRIVLTYSGSIASGKSTITKHLADRYRPLIVNNDEVRSIIKLLTHESSYEKIQAIMFSYYKNFLRDKLYSSSNKIIILDSSIDRRYDIVNAEYTGNGYSLFIILFDHPRELIEKRIKERDGDLAETHLAILDQAFIDNQSFLKLRRPDYVITEKNQNDTLSLFESIDSFIDSHRRQSTADFLINAVNHYWQSRITTQLPTDLHERYQVLEDAGNNAAKRYNKQRESGFERAPWSYAKNAQFTAKLFKSDLPSFTEIYTKLTTNPYLVEKIFTHIRNNDYFNVVWTLPTSIIFENLMLLIYRTAILFSNEALLFDTKANSPLVQLSCTIEEMVFCEQLENNTSPLFFAYKHWLLEWKEEDFDERLYSALKDQL